MNWFSVPPHISVGTTFRIRALVTIATPRPGDAAPGRISARQVLLQRHGQAGDAEEIELVGDRMEHRRDDERHQRDLHAGGEQREVAERRIAAPRASRRPARVRKQSRCSQTKSSRPGSAEVDRVLQIRVVDRPPGVVAALARSCARMSWPMPTPMIGFLRDDLGGDLDVLPAALRRAGLVRLDVGDRAEAVDVAGRQQRRHAERDQQQQRDGGARRLPPREHRRGTSRTIAASVRNPARENVRIDGRDAQEQRAGGDQRAPAPREMNASAPRSG